MERLFCATALALCFLVLTGAKRPVGHDSQEASDPSYSLVGHTFAGFPVGLALCSNRDREVKRPIPEPSEVRVVKIR